MNATTAMDTTGTAIVFDDLGFTGLRCTAGGEPRESVASDVRHAPPSLIVPRFPGEPLRLDCAIPLHPRGTGCPWPPEARVDDESGAGRFPLAAAWAGLPSGRKWTWRPDGHVLEVSPAHAIATAFADVLRLHPRLKSDGTPTLVIPNTTREVEQQALLDEASQAGVPLQLLWRPVSAAMAWCEENRDFLRECASNRRVESGDVLGRLVCIHLGLAQAETAVLDLVLEEREGQAWFIPARRRPDPAKDSFESLGWAFLRDQASAALANVGLPTDDQHFWQILLASNFASVSLAKDDEGLQRLESVRIPSGVQLPAMAHASTNGMARRSNVEFIGRCSFAQTDANAVLRWVEDGVRFTGERILGAVVTGEMASVAIGGGPSLGRRMLSFLRLPEERNMLGGLASGRTILSRGAALFSARLAAGLPTYLDTLPRLQLLIRRRGEVVWEDLLEESHAYVPGGRIWIRPEPVSDLAIPRGEQSLVFAVYHEEHPGVRELNVQLQNS